MSAIPLRSEKLPEEEKLVVLELCNTGNTLDLYSDRLSSQGYSVLSANSYQDALRLAREYEPALIVVYDQPDTNIDAVEWLQIQHTDLKPQLAMTPLRVLADAVRVPELRVQEIPDRVVVLQRRADTLNQLTRTVKRILNVWGFE
jgi:response regulator RpfG family c-di-GMP phosphodiesterase